MDRLPIELIDRIMSLLEYRSLASAARVCRTWRQLTDQESLWKRLYERRWGSLKAAKACLDASTSQSWKAAYEVQDRWDRVGEEMTIVREGQDYFLAKKGHLLRFLGSSNNKSLGKRRLGGIGCATHRQDSSSSRTTGSSHSGLLDKLIHFVADLDYEHRRLTKRAHVVRRT